MDLKKLMDMGLTEEQAKKVLEAYKESLRDRYVPIERFNEVNEAKNQLEATVKERDTQLQELKTKATGNDELTAKITELEKLNKATKEEYEAKMSVLKKETAIELKLKDEKAKNVKAVKALLDLERVNLDGNNLIGLDDQLKTLKESDAYLFGEDKISGRDPHPGGDSLDSQAKKNPFSKEHFNLTEQGRLFREDPELAAKLQELAK